jgi:hypothetical protein
METSAILDLVIKHWPFCVVGIAFAILGRVADRVFTRERAYVFNRSGRKIGKHFFWFWMRETLPAHPLVLGCLLGAVMPDPEGQGWGRPLILLYFVGASLAGLACWIYMRARGKSFPLPGESEPPRGEA